MDGGEGCTLRGRRVHLGGGRDANEIEWRECGREVDLELLSEGMGELDWCSAKSFRVFFLSL